MSNLLRFLAFDRAIAYSMMLKLWQALAGLVSIFLVVRYFSLEAQGFYYTFASLIALQSFLELGLYLVVTNFASHEWSKLQLCKDGRIEGDSEALSRLVSLGRFIFKWYAATAFLFLGLVGCGGYWFLGQAPGTDVDWQAPWIIHVVFSAFLLWCLPFLALLEGCDQVAQVAKFRFWLAFLSNLAFWIVIAMEGGLWAAPVLSMVSALLCLYYLLVSRKIFFKPFLQSPVSEKMAWKSEIFPMQWRLALQGLMSYFTFSLFTPVMFYYHGPTIAGQMGMTLQIVMAMLSIALIWITVKVPRFGVLVAQRDFHRLDSEWSKASLLSVILMACGVIVTYVTLAILSDLHWEPVSRLLSPAQFLMLAVGGIFAAVVQCAAIYLRAHKKEVLTKTGMISGALMAIMVWKLGMIHGPVGATGSFLIVMSVVTFPMVFFIWKKSRLEWHRCHKVHLELVNDDKRG